jgi:amphi-Trp domain-containing protein
MLIMQAGCSPGIRPDDELLLMPTHLIQNGENSIRSMDMEKVLFKSKEKKQTSEVASILRTVADKIESGRITLSQGGEENNLSIPDAVILEIKVEEETKADRDTLKKSLEIELEWYEGESGKAASGGVSIG